MENYSVKYLVKLGLFGLIYTIVSMAVTYGFVYLIEWIQEGGIQEFKNRRKAKKEAKQASRYVTKTVESR